jgi:hypothetical protein
MSETAPSAPTLTASDYLSEPLHVGEPDVFESLAVYPVFGPEPEQPYVSFAQGREQGAAIKEIESGASVNDVVIENPMQTPVLLFEGEEVLGAQQNRTFDLTVLVAGGSKLRLPVSCVEAGRWDGSRHLESFTPAPQTAYAELRRVKAMRVHENIATGAPARADQSEVWENVNEKSVRMNARSATGAAHDIYENHRSRLGEFVGSVDLHERQSGALVAIGGRFVVLDWVSRPEVFASLHTALVQGYALDALEADETKAPEPEDAKSFISLASAARTSERDGIGLGREVRFAESNLLGTGLVADHELVQLTVHNDHGPADHPTGAQRVQRPSRRSG